MAGEPRGRRWTEEAWSPRPTVSDLNRFLLPRLGEEGGRSASEKWPFALGSPGPTGRCPARPGAGGLTWQQPAWLFSQWPQLRSKPPPHPGSLRRGHPDHCAPFQCMPPGLHLDHGVQRAGDGFGSRGHSDRACYAPVSTAEGQSQGLLPFHGEPQGVGTAGCTEAQHGKAGLCPSSSPRVALWHCRSHVPT